MSLFAIYLPLFAIYFRIVSAYNSGVKRKYFSKKEYYMKADTLEIKVFKTRTEMGKKAAEDAERIISDMLKTKSELNIIFAAAPSQNEFLDALCKSNIPWNKINAYHMDEYIGLPSDAPQGFANFLRRAIFDRVNFKSVNTMDSTADADNEAKRYSKLIDENPPDIIFMGIGENGHIAFNDPPVADFSDTQTVKKVKLDPVCRMQQVHDGCFDSLDKVPEYALTLTVPVFKRAAFRICVVPSMTKTAAVAKTVRGKIGEYCPATILRTLENSILYCDAESAAEI